MNAAAIEITKARRVFDGLAVVRDVTLTAPAGRALALLGPSGSGKSTLLRMIAGLEPIDGGEILIDGARVAARNFSVPAEQRQVGMVFQDYALFPHLTAAANVAFGMRNIMREERDAAARSWLERVGLATRADAYPHEMSGGEQQRVALARALAPRPRAILLDEPFSGLDSSLRAALRDLTLTEIAAANATAIFVTHDVDEALYVADRLAVLHAGTLLQADAPRVVYDHPLSPEAAAALGPVNICTARVENGVVRTPFGALPAQGLSGDVRVVVRAEALSFTPGDAARVTARKPQGAFDLALIESQGVTWRATIPARGGPQCGDATGVAIDPAGAHIFPA